MLTKYEILSLVPQQEIFQRYLGIPVEFGKMVCNPLRSDQHPTCNFVLGRNGEIWFNDYSGYFKGNCFDLVSFIYQVPFSDACAIIERDFGLSGSPVTITPLTVFNAQVAKIQAEPKEKARITIQSRLYNRYDQQYWWSFRIHSTTLELFNVKAVNHALVNGSLIYSYLPANPGYAYVFSSEDIKIYFPLKEKPRFVGNTSVIQGYNQLPENGQLLIITKSMKDVMVYHEMGYTAISWQGEGTVPSETQIEELKKRFSRILLNYDHDPAGISTAEKIRDLYGIPHYFFTNGDKDLSDLVKAKGFSYALSAVTNLITTT